MKIELIKEESLNGETWHFVKADGITQAAFRIMEEEDRERAQDQFFEIVERAKSGPWPKSVVIAEETVNE